MKSKSLDAFAKAIMDAKQPEYTNQDKDVLANFKRTAEISLESQEVWQYFLYMYKQYYLMLIILTCIRQNLFNQDMQMQ